MLLHVIINIVIIISTRLVLILALFLAWNLLTVMFSSLTFELSDTGAPCGKLCLVK